MDQYGHYGINATVAIPFVIIGHIIFGVTGSTLTAAVMIATARVPDWDLYFDSQYSHGNAITNRIPLTHRGGLHTVWFALVCGAAVFAVGVVAIQYITPSPSVAKSIQIAYYSGLTAVGVCGHLLADSFTPAGITPLAPVDNTNYSFNFFYADSRIANMSAFIGGSLLLLTTLGVLIYQFSTIIPDSSETVASVTRLAPALVLHYEE